MINISVRNSKKLGDGQSAFFSFPYNDRLVNLMRQQGQRAWIPDTKEWELPLATASKLIPGLAGEGITLTGTWEPVQKKDTSKVTDYQFKTAPYQHQVKGFEYGMQYDRFLLADEQGLGKTKQVIDIAVARKQKQGFKHCLIICGVNGLKYNWQEEVGIHSNESAWILGTRYNRRGKPVVKGNAEKLEDLERGVQQYFIITNIESLRSEGICSKLAQMCKAGEINMVAVDEMHRCKNPSSQQGKAIQKIQAEVRIAMTGTPLMNQPLDLYIILKWLGFENHSFYQFKNHYCVMGGYGGYEIVAYKNMSELREKLEYIMLRRLKSEVLDLPEKVYVTEYVEMSKEQAKVYDEVTEEVMQNIDKIKASPNPLSQLTRMRQATGYTGILSTSIKESAKLDRMEELVEEAVAGGEKVIIFSNWTQITDEVMKRLRKYRPALITGQISAEEKEEQKHRFQNDQECKVIIGTIAAMGTGLTLTAGTLEIFLDSPWNRANKEQAVDRAHRIGTKSILRVVTIVCKGTIDERIEDIVYRKGIMSDMLVDGRFENSKPELIDMLLS